MAIAGLHCANCRKNPCIAVSRALHIGGCADIFRKATRWPQKKLAKRKRLNFMWKRWFRFFARYGVFCGMMERCGLIYATPRPAVEMAAVAALRMIVRACCE